MVERKGPNKTELLQIRYRDGITFSNYGLVPDDIITAFPMQGRRRLQEQQKAKDKKNPL